MGIADILTLTGDRRRVKVDDPEELSGESSFDHFPDVDDDELGNEASSTVQTGDAPLLGLVIAERVREVRAWRSFSFGELFSEAGEALTGEVRDACGKWQPEGQTGTIGREDATYGVLSYVDAHRMVRRPGRLPPRSLEPNPQTSPPQLLVASTSARYAASFARCCASVRITSFAPGWSAVRCHRPARRMHSAAQSRRSARTAERSANSIATASSPATAGGIALG
jgi:hypothetical protein